MTIFIMILIDLIVAGATFYFSQSIITTIIVTVFAQIVMLMLRYGGRGTMDQVGDTFTSLID